MEAWLGATGGETTAGGAATAGVGPISSSEFDDFLASRLQGSDAAGAGAAAAIRNIGDVPSVSATSGAVPRGHRTSKKDDESDKDLLLA
jgi:hypothetical protein